MASQNILIPKNKKEYKHIKSQEYLTDKLNTNYMFINSSIQ